MAFEMPVDQIKQLQILLRKEANLSWYQPENEENLPLPKLSSVAETVAKLDPSPPYLRCKNCNGRLLRDLQSFICVFCGTNPNKDLPPDPIKFKNTVGYRWLLESLNLDGSEMVAPMEEENASNKGRSESKDEIPLSELLDLEIRWPSEADRILSSNSDSETFPGNSSLNLAGVDLDSFFDGRESDSYVSEQNLAFGRQVGGGTSDNNTSQASENLSFFRNVQASEAAIGSAEDQSGDSISGWEANFKSAGSGSVHEEPKSVDHWKESVDVKNTDDFNPSASTDNDWFQGDGWRTSNSGPHGKTGKSEVTTDLNHIKTAEITNVSSTRNLDWMQDDQWQGSDNKMHDVVAMDEADDSFDAWNDFTGSVSTQDPSSITSSSKITGQSGKSNGTKSADGANSSSNRDFGWMQDEQWQNSNNKITDNISTNETADSFDAWNDFTGSVSTQDPSSIISSSNITGQTEKSGFSADHNDKKTAEGANSSSFDWMHDQWLGSDNKTADNISRNEAADSFDTWNDFTSSANTQYSSGFVSNSEITGQTGKFELTKDPKKTADSATDSSNNFDWMQDDQWQGRNNKETGVVTTNEVTDSFDAWNDFTGSAISQNPCTSGQTGKSEITADLSDSKTVEDVNASSVKGFDWMQDDQWQFSNNKTTDTGTTTTNDIADPFDAWNGFTSSASTQDPSCNVWKQNVHQTFAEKNSETNLLSSSSNSQDADFSGFLQRDLILGQFNSPPRSPVATNVQPAAASSNRVADADTMRGNAGDVSTAEVETKDDVEMLLTQMHDLSFMLESNLSIPPK